MMISFASAQNLITDGGFSAASPNASYTATLKSSTPVTINAWQIGSMGANNGHTGSVAPISTNSGIVLTNNKNSSGFTFVQQSVSGLVVSQYYTITFQIAAGTLDVLIDANSITGNLTVAGSTLTTETITFQASSTSQVVRFQNTGGANATVQLNNISMAVATPEPKAIAAAILIVAGIGAVERRRLSQFLRHSTLRGRMKEAFLKMRAKRSIPR